jgi:hypothetical protein
VSEDNYNFKESVVDNLEIGYKTIMMSLEDERLAYEILADACEEFQVVHFANLKKIREQRNAINKGNFLKSREGKQKPPRKAAGRRIYHPTGSYLFYYLVKERIALEEKRQEVLGIPVTNKAILFRFFHNLFENNNFLKGAFLPITAMYGIVHNIDPRILVKISSHFHGIDADYDTKDRDYRGPDFFSEKGGNLLTNATNRFAETGFFEMVRSEEQALLHREIKEALNGDIDYYIKFEPADKETIAVVENILDFLTPWGAVRLSPDDIPKYNLSHTRIPALESRNSATSERELETIRSATSMSLPFAKEMLKNESVRKNNMSDNIYVPVLNKKQNFSRDSQATCEFDEKFILQVAMKQLEKPMTQQNLNNFVLAVEADGIEIGSVSSKLGKARLQVPSGTRKLSVLVKCLRKDNTEESFPVMVVPIAFTGLDGGEPWLGESTLENNNHLALNLTPVINTRGREVGSRHPEIKSFELVLDYHTPEKCGVHSKPGFVNGLIARLAGLRNWVQPDIVSKPIDGFLHNLEATKYFSESKAKRNGIRSSLRFTVAVNGVTLLLALGLYLAKDKLPDFWITSETVLIATIFLVTVSLMIASFFLRRDGINKIISFCNHFGFLGGLVSIVLLMSIFTHNWGPFSDSLGMLVKEDGISSLDLQVPESSLNPYKNPVLPVEYAELDQNSEEPNDAPVNGGVLGNVQVDIPYPKGRIRYVSNAINIKDVKKGYIITAYVSDPFDESNDEISAEFRKATYNFANSLNATVTSVERDSSPKSDVVVKVKVDTFDWKSKLCKPLDDNDEVTVVFNSGQIESQIALIMEQGKVLYGLPIQLDSRLYDPEVKEDDHQVPAPGIAPEQNPSPERRKGPEGAAAPPDGRDASTESPKTAVR